MRAMRTATALPSIRSIADILEMPHEQFAELWNQLPIDDKRIAELFGLTRQQVIKLRHSARLRLKRTLGDQAAAQSPLVLPTFIRRDRTINTVHPLVVPLSAFPPQHHEELPEPHLRMFLRQQLQRIFNLAITLRLRTVVMHRPRQLHQLTCPSLA